MRVCVIGATGYLGAHICKLLSSSNYEVIAWGHSRPVGWENWAHSFREFNLGDVTSSKVLDDIVAQQPDAIIYCASKHGHQSESDICNALAINIEPVWQLLGRMKKVTNQIRFVYLSTIQVYGMLSGIVSEKLLAKPLNNYGLSHLLAENIVSRYHAAPDFSCVNLRLSNGYGAPYFKEANCWQLVANAFCRSAVDSGEIKIKSDGLPQRDFIHVNDIFQAIRLMLDVPQSMLESTVYNVGGSETYTILELAQRVASIAQSDYGLTVPIYIAGRKVYEDVHEIPKMKRFNYSSERMEMLGYEPKISIDEGIKEIMQYLAGRE